MTDVLKHAARFYGLVAILEAQLVKPGRLETRTWIKLDASGRHAIDRPMCGHGITMHAVPHAYHA